MEFFHALRFHHVRIKFEFHRFSFYYTEHKLVQFEFNIN